jgi:hypothetical protein
MEVCKNVESYGTMIVRKEYLSLSLTWVASRSRFSILTLTG